MGILNGVDGDKPLMKYYVVKVSLDGSLAHEQCYGARGIRKMSLRALSAKSSIIAGRVQVSPKPLGIPATQPAFKE